MSRPAGHHHPAYVRDDGRLVRSRCPGLATFRVLLVLALASALIVTNPANDARNWPGKARGVFDGLAGRLRGGRGSVYGRDDYHEGSARGTRRSKKGAGAENAGSLWEALDAVSYSIFGTETSSFVREVFGGGSGESSAGVGRRGASTTNYVLYSLERDFRGVQVAVLSKRFELCHFGLIGEGGDLCGWIGAWIDLEE
uniref:Uncharacterized protein n=1 Tax=Odontella aurita TaxID=265563 RepID=A0A6U6EW39_9STRA|mmetsp:Transcript_29946/g.89062  ORF Transcript_29946/g.89062 Transcript_29946/m.89062 type:complete len:198 (+) Transcript_29946:185-778(+)